MKSMPRIGLRTISVVLAAAAAASLSTAVAQAGPPWGAPEQTRIERVLPQINAPDTDVVKSIVEIYSPLSGSLPPHPPECDWARHIRFRHQDGPTNSAEADSIFPAVPGNIGGADEYEPTARNFVHTAALQGKHVEYWVIVRRSECLNDRTGLDAAMAAKDYHVAIDYYYNKKVINGRQFKGWGLDTRDGKLVFDWIDNRFLGGLGIEQTLTDWKTAIVDGVPNPADRPKKVFCGGHSLGGLDVSALSGWDFDGNPATLDDAGYNLCGGFVALDSSLTTDAVGAAKVPILNDATSLLLGLIDGSVHLSTSLGIIPNIDFRLLLTPETFTIMGIAGLAAFYQPDQESTLLRELPPGVNRELLIRGLLARDWVQFATNVPDVRSFRYTNEALLGSFFDDNSTSLSMIGHGVGSLSGGPLAEKSFVLPEIFGQIPLVGPMIGPIAAGPNRVGPTDPNVLYTWKNYDKTADLLPDGRVFTAPELEVTDIRDLAAQTFQGPTSYIDSYFPLTGMWDDIAAVGGSHLWWLEKMQHRDGIKRRPNMVVFADSGPVVNPLTLFNPLVSLLNPTDPEVAPKDSVHLHGYRHLDVIMAAPKQNNGKPEQGTRALLDFVLSNTR